MCTYKFYTDKENRKVVLCLMKYRDKTIKGKAVCHADDTYDEEVGKNLARKRCEIQFLSKKIRDKYIYREEKYRAALQATADYANADVNLDRLYNQYAMACEDLVSYTTQLKEETK